MFSKTTKRVVAWLCMMAMVLGMMVTNADAVYAAEAVTSTEAAGEHTMWIIGDSTVCEFNDAAYYYPRYGYGTQIGNYLDGTYTIQNLAASGRSSLSYMTDEVSGPMYETLMNGMTSGDVLVIGFGHNDEKTEVARYTNPNGDYTTAGSFEYVLYENYVKPAMDAGVEVILCTPIVRRDASDAYTGDKVHVTSTKTVEDSTNGAVTYEGGDYAQAIRDLGAAFNLTVIDLTELTKAAWQSAGAAETLYFHAWTSSKEGSVDNTHVNIYGAKKVAYMFAQAVAASSSSVASHVVLGTEPTKANDLVSNPDYVEPTYNNNLAQSELWSDYGIFKGTAFGALGGNPSKSNYTLETDTKGNMHMLATNNKGKVTDGADGIVMYYYKVPVGKNFSLKATATLNAFVDNKQVGFGLMARDDMYIDSRIDTLLSDYVAAATSPDGSGGGYNCYYRNAGTLNRKVKLTTETLKAGNSYDLSIVSNSDGYACTFGNEPTQTGGYDFQLTTIDSDYVYIGMFVARNCDVTYSNIELIVDGQQIDIMTGEVIGGGSTGGGEDPVDPTPTNTVEDFVKRMYTVALGRDAEEAGVNNWVAALNVGTHDGAGIAEEFVLGDEFVMRGLSDEQYVDTLYQTFFNRAADEGGKELWLAVLASGQSRGYVLSNFVNLAEFTMLCETYGIERGVMLESGVAVNPGIPQFVKRMYTIVLGRDAENDGLYNNTLALVVGSVTTEDVAKNFFTSEEYTIKGKDDAAYVTDLYAAFMNREADATGLAFWTETIAVGMSRDEVLSEFAKSEEFKAIAASYGLQ